MPRVYDVAGTGFCPWETTFLVGSPLARAVREVREIAGRGEAVTEAALASRGVCVLDEARCGGGSVPNALCAVAAAGASAAVAGGLGDDEEGRLVRNDFEHHHIDCRWLIADRGRTALSVVLTRAGTSAPRQLTVRGRRGVAHPGSASCPSCRVLHLAYPGARQLAWAEEHKRCGGLLSVDVGAGWARNIGCARATKLLALADLVIVSRANAGRLTGHGRGVALGARTAALRSLLGPETLLVVTLGAEGAIASRADLLLRLSPPTVEAVDPTGAGDCLAGHLAAALAHDELAGDGFERALRRAVAASALSVTALSARGRLPSRQEAEAWAVKVTVDEVTG